MKTFFFAIFRYISLHFDHFVHLVRPEHRVRRARKPRGDRRKRTPTCGFPRPDIVRPCHPTRPNRGSDAAAAHVSTPHSCSACRLWGDFFELGLCKQSGHKEINPKDFFERASPAGPPVLTGIAWRGSPWPRAGGQRRRPHFFQTAGRDAGATFQTTLVPREACHARIIGAGESGAGAAPLVGRRLKPMRPAVRFLKGLGRCRVARRRNARNAGDS